MDWTPVILGIALAVFLARLPLTKEIILGLVFLAISSSYHFYLQPSLNLPAFPEWFVLFLGVFAVFRAILLFAQVFTPYGKLLTFGGKK